MRTSFLSLFVLLSSALALAASSGAKYSRAAFGEDTSEAPEACWTAVSGDEYRNGHFAFTVPAKEFTAAKMADFLDEALGSNLRLIRTYSETYDNSSTVYIELAIPEKHPRTSGYRKRMSAKVRALLPKLPAPTFLNCVHHQQEEEEQEEQEGPGTSTGT